MKTTFALLSILALSSRVAAAPTSAEETSKSCYGYLVHKTPEEEKAEIAAHHHNAVNAERWLNLSQDRWLFCRYQVDPSDFMAIEERRGGDGLAALYLARAGVPSRVGADKQQAQNELQEIITDPEASRVQRNDALRIDREISGGKR